jgi:hypothetical protein
VTEASGGMIGQAAASSSALDGSGLAPVGGSVGDGTVSCWSQPSSPHHKLVVVA